MIDEGRILTLAGELAHRSYYQVLGVAPSAGHDHIRARFAELARNYHPDRHRGSVGGEVHRALVSIQARLNEAYRVLSNPRKRAAYDRELAGGQVRLTRQAETHEGLEPTSASARRFFRLARERELAGDCQGALIQLELARQLEPSSPAIRAALERLRQPQTSSADAGGEHEQPDEFDTPSGLSEVELFGDLDD